MVGHLELEIMNARVLSYMKVLEYPIHKLYLYLVSQYANCFFMSVTAESKAMATLPWPSPVCFCCGTTVQCHSLHTMSEYHVPATVANIHDSASDSQSLLDRFIVQFSCQTFGGISIEAFELIC